MVRIIFMIVEVPSTGDLMLYMPFSQFIQYFCTIRYSFIHFPLAGAGWD